MTLFLFIAPPDEDQFRVRLRQSTSLLFHGSCILEIQRDFERNLFHIAVFTEENPPRLIVKWQIDHIRQYGSNEVAFKFQSGRLLINEWMDGHMNGWMDRYIDDWIDK